ncbi:MAG: IPExxxVDY family protein [Bacteroidia bacterium]|nr:IPExxxVDY family protein [Bacteroidia bacterium]
MAKNVLKLNEEDKFDFFLFGISCQHKDYRLCREINLALEVEMTRRDDFDIYNNKRMEEQGFAFFRYDTEDEDQFCLVSNRGPKGLLIPEQKQIDYFLMIKPGRMRIDENEIQNSLKSISIVLAVYMLDVLKLKSKGNLVF